jgi:hypothetical protein
VTAWTPAARSEVERYGRRLVTTSGSARDAGISSRPSSDRAIANLIATYAHLVDAGDFAGVGALLADATFSGASGTVHGAAAIETMLRDRLIVYDDGTPRTKHLTTNVAIEVDETAGTARSRSYFTVLQAAPDLALQPIVSGRYDDRFERRDGRWCFSERRVVSDLVGDVSHHLRPAAPERT